MAESQEDQEYSRVIENRLICALSDKNHLKISIKNFYKCFDIHVPNAEIPELIKKVNNEGNAKSKLSLKNMLPPGTAKSIENFLDYELPRELLNICYDEMDSEEKELQEEYLEMQKNPSLFYKISAFFLSTAAHAYSSFLRLKSGGFEYTKIQSQKQILQEMLDMDRQDLRKQLKDELPQEMLYEYLVGLITTTQFNQKVEYFKDLDYSTEDILEALELNVE